MKKGEKVASFRLGMWIDYLSDVTQADLYEMLNSLNHENPPLGLYHHQLLAPAMNIKRKLTSIRNGIKSNGYGIECECSCDRPNDAYVNSNWIAIGIDDDIHFCPAFIASANVEEITITLVHELSHFYLGTSDRYTWMFDGDFNQALSLAQFYENVIISGVSRKSIEGEFRKWVGLYLRKHSP